MHGGPERAPGDELVEVVDEHGEVVRLATRAEMRAGNLRHRSVGIVVTTSADELVVQRRADWKDVWPGLWDIGFGGVVGVGEGWLDAARRELAEESGVDVPVSGFHELGHGAFADADVRTFARFYGVRHDGPFRPADGEVAELVLVPRTEFPAWLAGRLLCPDTVALVVPLLRLLPLGVPGGDPPPPPPRSGE